MVSPLAHRQQTCSAWDCCRPGGQSLMHYTGHSHVTAAGISLWVSLSQIFNTNRRTSGLWSHRVSPRDPTRGARSRSMLNYWNSSFSYHAWDCERLIHCTDVTLSLQTLNSKRGLSLTSRGSRLQGDSGLMATPLVHRPFLVLCVTRNPLGKMRKTHSRQWIPSSKLATCGLRFRGAANTGNNHMMLMSFLNPHRFPVAALFAPLLQRQHQQNK